MAPLPLEQREWRKQAQRTTRISLTAIRSAWSSFEKASEKGRVHLQALSNTLLLLIQVHSMTLGALSNVKGIREKAARKLSRQYQAALIDLCNECQEMERCANEACAAANAILDLVGTGMEGEEGGSIRPWQSISPVFASIAAPRFHLLLREVYSMMQRESEVKGSICQLMSPLEPSKNQPSDSSVISSRVLDALMVASDDGVRNMKSEDDDDLLRSCLSVALTSWISNVYLDGDKYEEVVRVLADEMSGF